MAELEDDVLVQVRERGRGKRKGSPVEILARHPPYRGLPHRPASRTMPTTSTGSCSVRASGLGFPTVPVGWASSTAWLTGPDSVLLQGHHWGVNWLRSAFHHYPDVRCFLPGPRCR